MATNPSLLGRVVAGRYRIESRRGAGDHGVVLDAFDEQLERVVALKLLLPHYVSNTAAEARFRFEAQAAASLTHPNLNAVYDWGVEEIEGAKLPYLVLEHLGGGSLRDILDRGRLLTPSQALVVGLDVCRGLDYMHRRGVIHRELKPANLAFGDDRHVRILDVGLSRLVAEETWYDPALAGIDAARYASPEQARGGSPEDGTLDASTDIYSLTLILIEAVTGQVPFASDSVVGTLNARIDKLMPVSADFGPLASVLSRAGSAVPGDRYTAAEFGRALVQAAEKLPRPAAIPIVGSSIYSDTTGGLRRPADPTGPAPRPMEGMEGVDPSSPTVRTPLPTTEVPIVDSVPPPPSAVGAASLAAVDVGAATPPPPPAGAHATPLFVSDATPPPPPPPSATNAAGGAFHDEAGGPIGPPTIPMQPVGVDDSGAQSRPVLYDEGELPPRRRRKGWIVALVIVLLALAGGGLIAFQQLKDKSYAVPDLVGLDEGVARNQVAGHDWTIVVSKERNDDQPQGHVVRTDPIAGTMLKEGRPITFVVSEGPTLSKLPDVNGQTVDAATATLADSKLDIVVASQDYSETVPAGSIISWTVPAQPGLGAGMEVMQHTVVSVVVSKGPAPRQVPTLVGLDPAAAQAAVEAVQLVFQRDPNDVFSDKYPAGIVADQSVAPGTEVARGDTIVVAVSKGPDVITVPSLAGLSYDQVVSTLQSAGFVVGTVTGDTANGSISLVTANGQPVTLGQQFPRGTKLDLTYT